MRNDGGFGSSTASAYMGKEVGVIGCSGRCQARLSRCISRLLFLLLKAGKR